MNKYNSSSVCPKSGIKIHKSDNDYKKDPFTCNAIHNQHIKQNIFTNCNINSSHFVNNEQNVQKKTNQIIDLNIDNYSREDLYELFGISNIILTDEIMKESKKIVLKTHPDKSKLDPKFFLFYSQAYKRLYSIYEFQNKSTKKQGNEVYIAEQENENENNFVLNKMFDEHNSLKKPEDFNKWFNKEFDKYKLEDANENGYGEWLKSNEGISNITNVSKADINSEFEKQKKQIQALNVYKGVNDTYTPMSCGASLMEFNDNFTSGNLFSNDSMGYTDLRQAYVESIIPVTEDDFNKVQKFKNVEEYKNYRNNTDITPLQKEEAERILYFEKKKLDEDNVALAFHYAKQTEKSIKNSNSFWSTLKQLTNK
jgi:curved DNA-binding protein CbpA